jgi:uncharacterized membrane protein
VAPLIVMVAVWVGARALGMAGLAAGAATWSDGLRFGLAGMFLLTGVSHFVPRTRRDLVRMVPPQLTAAEFLVTLTGVLELAGAVGLLVPSLVRPAAYGLQALLVLMFPANVYAARAGLTIAGRRATPLVARLPLQVFWIAALLWVARASAAA